MDDTLPSESEPQAVEPDASIGLADTARGVDISVNGDQSSNSRAIHFAHWIGRHLDALIKLSQDDYNDMLESRRKARRLLEPKPPVLVGADGSRLQ